MDDGAMASASAAAFRILLCDDHKVLTDALSVLIGLDPRFHLVASPVQTGQEAVDLVQKLAPDVVLMDVELIGAMSGFEATAEITKHSPQTKVIIVSGSTDPDTALLRAIEAGASGFLAKTEPASRILDLVQAAAEGAPIVDTRTLTRVLREVAQNREDRRQVLQKTDSLTAREREILRSLAQGLSNAQIASILHISPFTVQTHTRNILLKLDVHSKLQAVALGARAGLLVA